MDIKLTMNNLNKNGIDTYLVDTKTDVINKIDELVNKGDTVAVGGSMTLDECGVTDYLCSGKFTFLDRNAASADVFFCSSNAVTENGELYNVDGFANRISAIAFGPKSVIMVVGTNKLVKNLDEAIYRVKTVCAPKNAARLTCDTYCKTTGKCKSLLNENSAMSDGCDGSGRICCDYLVSSRQRISGRIKIIFVNESLGY